MQKGRKIKIHQVEFTVQDLLIIQKLKEGATYQEISEKLSISSKSVEYYVKSLKEKTHTYTKKELLEFFEKDRSEKTFCNMKENILEVAKDESFLKKIAVIILFMSVAIFFFLKGRTDIREVTNVIEFNNNFLNRPVLKSKIFRVLNKQTGIKTAVICGQGGSGKTTICRKILSEMNEGIKFEINSETEETLYNSFLELADYLSEKLEQKKELDIIRNLQNTEYQRKTLIRFVSDQLKKSNKWILLFDNIESLEHVKEYLPGNEKVWGKGQILITTRNQNLGESNFIKQDWIINIGELEEREKRELFTNIVYGIGFSDLSQKEADRVENFLKQIPKYPLDVCAVAYYLKNTGVTFDEYKKIMSNNLKDLSDEQKRLIKENSSYNETRYGIVSSIFKRIVNDKKDKQSLLIICLLDSQNIPKRVLRDIVGAVSAGRFIFKLKEHSLIADNKKEISMHRSSHEIGYQYILEHAEVKEIEAGIHKLAVFFAIQKRGKNELIPHLEAILRKISKLKSEKISEDESKLLMVLSDILKSQSYKMKEALSLLERILVINEKQNCLDRNTLALVRLRAGEICTLMNQNTQAENYLSNSLLFFSDNTMEKVRNYRLLGIIRMRRHDFGQANEYFMTALSNLRSAVAEKVQKKLSESNIYEDMSFNYFMDGINRENARRAVPLMEKAIEVLNDPELKNFEEVISRKAVHKIKLAGIFNALGEYQKALDIAKETEKLINKSGFDNSDIFYVKGLIARERGLSYLRLNKVKLAYNYFEEARNVFTKLMKGDYLFKLKTHEAECLIRMNRLEEALKKCKSMFEERDRERNNYADLFYNTSLYHAAVIEYYLGKYEESKRYFQQFFQYMKIFCKQVFPKENYLKLMNQNVFDENPQTMKKFFRNSLKIFEEIYWKDYEFTKYYVEKNWDSVKFR